MVYDTVLRFSMNLGIPPEDYVYLHARALFLEFASHHPQHPVREDSKIVRNRNPFGKHDNSV